MSEPTSLMLESENEWLKEQAGKMSSAVEIGSFHGSSTIILLGNVKGPVWCVDPWRFVPENFVTFAENIKDWENLIIMKMASTKAFRFFPDNSVDMVFIDGDHRYPTVKADINNWLPIARLLICGHDYGHPHYPGVKHAVDKLDGVEIYETIWYKWL
jgi:hypothetical protein